MPLESVKVSGIRLYSKDIEEIIEQNGELKLEIHSLREENKRLRGEKYKCRGGHGSLSDDIVARCDD